MQFKAIISPSPNIQIKIPMIKQFSFSNFRHPKTSLKPFNLCFPKSHQIPRNLQKYGCISPSQEFLGENLQTHEPESDINPEIHNLQPLKPTNVAEEFANQSTWDQIIEIVKFSGPATGLWICGPLMSLIDTAVIGQGSSLELAALVATSNMVATSLAQKNEDQVQHQISMLLFISLASGVLLFILTKGFGKWALTAFVGAKNMNLVSAANSYLQIRALAWPAILVGYVAQSASLGMKDSLGPLKALLIATALSGIGDIVLCIFLNYGIDGAAWATAVSQIVAAYVMIDALNRKGYNGYSFSAPSLAELQEIFGIAAPIFVTMFSKVAFYGLLIYFATSMGTHVVAAHQVLLNIFGMCSVWGEPLSQTAQSFMPELLYGANRSLVKARSLLKSLLILGASIGLLLGTAATSVPFVVPNFFTSDTVVIGEMRNVWICFFLALSVTPCILPCEGTLLAGRDLKFISISMSGCFALGALVLLARFLISLRRLLSPSGVLFSEDLDCFRLAELKRPKSFLKPFNLCFPEFHPIPRNLQKNGCISPSQDFLGDNLQTHEPEPEITSFETNPEIQNLQFSEPTNEAEEFANQSTWDQMIEIIKFSGPATGLWICGPLMSLIDTADEDQVQHQISMLLFISLASGLLLFLLTKGFGEWALTAFVGVKNVNLVSAANSYIQIRALAWPAILVGYVAQSASLGMKDSLGPLKALLIASALNGLGDIVLCTFLNYGIAGAAWATAASQIAAAYVMIDGLNRKGYNGYSFSVPSTAELQVIAGIAAPVFVTMVSKVGFYGLLIYFATSMGSHVVAAHQVLLNIFGICSVWGEPLSQTAQSFMPELLYGANRSLVKARSLLKSLLIIGAFLGLLLGTAATAVPFVVPNLFTSDTVVIGEMRNVWICFFLALSVTPCILPCEGTLLAGRDLKFISVSMSGCFALGGIVLLLVRSQGLGLLGCWSALVGFQWARFLISLRRLLSPSGVLFSEDLAYLRLAELKVA
uniref:Protein DETOXIFICATION n=1 Tax=Chenopodium quinoa TaxID=63459 RepID=A0A803LPD0_CHEQI